MKIHTKIRQAAIAAVRQAVAGRDVSVFDGRPGFISDVNDLPAVAVYITDAQSAPMGGVLCGIDAWEAVLHVEIFLKSNSPDSELDEWTELLYRAVYESSELERLTNIFSPQGYDYLRDEEQMMWGSADFRFSITYEV